MAHRITTITAKSLTPCARRVLAIIHAAGTSGASSVAVYCSVGGGNAFRTVGGLVRGGLVRSEGARTFTLTTDGVLACYHAGIGAPPVHELAD